MNSNPPDAHMLGAPFLRSKGGVSAATTFDEVSSSPVLAWIQPDPSFRDDAAKGWGTRFTADRYVEEAKVSRIESHMPQAPTTVIAIDWSGRVDLAGQRRHIVAAVWREGKVRVESGRTRDEIADWLVALAKKDPALVVGFDFCFSFPAWFLHEVGAKDAPDFWRIVAERGEQWLARESPERETDRRFWGRPHKRPAEFSGEQIHRMLRATDIDCKLIAHIPDEERALRVKGITPKSVFQIGGSGSVGTASLRGMPVLLKLREAGFHIWPFDVPVAGQPLVVEMYTRLNTGPVHKSNPVARAAYLKRKRAEDPAYAALGNTAISKAKAGEDAFDALVSAMVMAAHRDSFYTLPKPRDPKYRLEGWTWAADICSL